MFFRISSMGTELYDEKKAYPLDCESVWMYYPRIYKEYICFTQLPVFR